MERKQVEKLLSKESLTDFIMSVDRLRFITRYATAPRSARESVAEHSFFVAAYVLRLAEFYQFDVTNALALALMHDYSESYISDVPHPIKAQNPKLEEALNEAESKVLREHLSEEMAGFLEKFNNKEGPEALVCVLADIISVVAYAKFEMELGNSSYMKQVYECTRPRFIQIIDSLRPYVIGDADAISKKIENEIVTVFNTRIENK